MTGTRTATSSTDPTQRAGDEPVLRPLGAFERTIDLYTRRNPVVFSLVMELDAAVQQDDLTAALSRLQRTHPLLAARIDDSSEPDRSVFRSTPAAVPLRTVAAGTPWRTVVAEEQTIPMAPAPTPLLRAVHIPRIPSDEPLGSTVVLTFSHQVADGAGALTAAIDLAALLDGADLTPGQVPEAQEPLLAAVEGTSFPGESGQAAVDSRLAVPGRLRPFDASIPFVNAVELAPGLTARLVERAQAEHCSVQGALSAAAARVFAAPGAGFVRINTPIDLRRAAGLANEVVVRFSAVKVGLDTGTSSGFWDLAREATGQIRAARTLGPLQAASAGLAAHAPTTPQEAEAAMAAATGAEIEITNLGEAAALSGAAGVTALWGPVMTTQLADEHVMGVITYRDRLRLVETTRDPIPGLLDRISGELADACA